jgi:hypothetical protein
MAETREVRGSASELKFLLDKALAGQVRAWARARLERDPHGTGPHGDEYLTTSLYFDTDARDVFYRRGSFGRAKYRVRRYGSLETVFLERKLRTSGMLVKRRTLMPIDVLSRLALEVGDSAWPGDWFHRRLLARRLRPACQVSYLRMARFGPVAGQGAARLTLDERLAVAAIEAAHFNGALGMPFLDDRVILELKFRGPLPALFKHLIEEFALAAQPASKYRFGMSALGLSPAAVPGPSRPSGSRRRA